MSRTKLNTAIATTALVVAVLGSTGVGQAARTFLLPSGSVGTAQLRSNAVTTAKVRNHTLLAADFKAGQLPAGPKGAEGQQGPKGAQGAAGAQGVPGPIGPKGTRA